MSLTSFSVVTILLRLADRKSRAVSILSDLNQRIKEQAEPGVLQVIEWALECHANTMRVLRGRNEDGSQMNPLEIEQLRRKYTLDEEEEARKILLEYGAGKPTRVVEHRGNKSKPIAFTTTIVPTTPQLKEPAPFAPAELVEDNESANT